MRRAVCQRQLSFLYCILVIMVRIEMYLCDLIRTSQSIDHLGAYFSQGSATTDLKGGGSFNSTFLHRSFLNLTVKKYENRSTVAEVIKIKVVHFLRHGVYLVTHLRMYGF